MSELRIYLRQDSLRDNDACAWAWQDGQTRRQGEVLTEAPSADRCVVVLAGDRALTLDAALPDVPARRLLPLLPGIVEGLTLEDAEQWHVQTLEQGGARRLLAVHKPWLMRCLDRLAAAGLRPLWACPETLLLPVQPGTWSVLLQDDGALLCTGSGDALALDRSLAGLQLALAHRTHPARIRVYRAADAKQAAPADLAASDIPLEDGGAWDWRSAALTPPANLLHGLPRNYGPGLDLRALARPLLAGLAVLAAVQCIGLGLHWAVLAREESALRAEMLNLAARALPAGASVVDPVWQVGEMLTKARAAAGEGGDGGISGMVGRLGRAWPQQGAAWLATLQADAAGLDLGVRNADAGWIEHLKTAAAREGLQVAPGKKDGEVTQPQITQLRITDLQGVRHGR